MIEIFQNLLEFLNNTLKTLVNLPVDLSSNLSSTIL